MAHHPPQISQHIPGVLHVLLPLLHSPLAAPHVYQTFLHFGTCVLQKQLHFLGKSYILLFIIIALLFLVSVFEVVFSSLWLFCDCLALLVGHVTLRLLKPECELDPAWSQEDLNLAIRRTIQLLHTQTVPHREGQTGERVHSN